MNPGDEFQHIYSTGSHTSPGLGMNLISRVGSIFCGSVLYTCGSGNIAIEAVSSISKFAGAVVVWLSTRSGSCQKQHGSPKYRNGHLCQRVQDSSFRGNPCQSFQDSSSCMLDLASSNIRHGMGFKTSGSASLTESLASSVKGLLKQFGPLHLHPVFSLAASLVLPIENLSSKVLAIPVEGSLNSVNRLVGQASTIDDWQGCSSFSLSRLCWTRDRVEPVTGIVFPTLLESGVSGDHFHRGTELLVGTGSRSMKIVKFKSLKLYAFGFYVQPDSVCEKLGSKYASVPSSDLKGKSQFFEDLLGADIDMTVRLVVNYNGIKIDAVKNAFEKSLRSRLEKMNPNSDHQCLNTFGSHFTQDILLPVGTTIDFKRTTDGRLITAIAGKHMGVVQSKDLCRAFFDMYLGESPVSAKAKEEVADNLADLMRRC